MDAIQEVLLIFHLAGIILALGAISPVMVLLMKSRQKLDDTRVFLDAFFTLRPVIWTGAALMAVSWFFLLQIPFEGIQLYKSIIIIALGINGAYITFYLGPKVKKHRDFKPGELIPLGVKDGLSASLTIAEIGWWALVVLTVLSL